jgi:Rrf2 family transcriptional regulator, nitric oxide-sensitive transcriptional repressor
MVLTKVQAELTILKVVNAVKFVGRIRECQLGLTAHAGRLCPLHNRLDNAIALVEEGFRHANLAEILAESTKSYVLCEDRMSKLTSKSCAIQSGN